MTEDSSRAVWLQQARSYLRTADPVLARLIGDRPDFDPGRGWLSCRRWTRTAPCCSKPPPAAVRRGDPPHPLPASRRSSTAISPSPGELLGVDPGKLREAGLSWRKISTL